MAIPIPTTYSYVAQADPAFAENIAGITRTPLVSSKATTAQQVDFLFADVLNADDEANLDEFMLGYGFVPV